MQYILSQDEYDGLKKQISNAKEEYKGTIDYLCMLVANHMPLTTYPGTKEEPQPWGCRVSIADEWYCDDCPVIEYCGMNKHYSA